MDFCCKCYMCSLTVLGLFWYCHFVYKQSLILHATAAHANQKGNVRQTCQQSVLSPIQRRSLHQNLMHSWCHGTVALKVCLQGLPFFPFPNFSLDRRPVHKVRLSKILPKQNKTKNSVTCIALRKTLDFFQVWKFAGQISSLFQEFKTWYECCPHGGYNLKLQVTVADENLKKS